MWNGFPERKENYFEYNETNRIGIKNCAEFSFVFHELSHFTFNEASKTTSFYYDHTNYIWCENPAIDTPYFTEY